MQPTNNARNIEPDPRPALPPTWLTAQELADLYRVNHMTIRKLAWAGRIPYARIGKVLRFRADAVEQALTRTP